MIVWIDGPFGAGKTTLAMRLRERLPQLLVFDPEEIGFVVKTIVPMPPNGNDQDLPLWRRLTIRTIAELRDHYPQDIAVPMTLLKPWHRDEILNAVRSMDPCFLHLYLDIDSDTLRDRITRQQLHPDESRNAQIRNWRLAQIEGCRAGRKCLPPGTLLLDSGKNASETLADRVIGEMNYLRRATR